MSSLLYNDSYLFDILRSYKIDIFLNRLFGHQEIDWAESVYFANSYLQKAGRKKFFLHIYIIITFSLLKSPIMYITSCFIHDEQVMPSLEFISFFAQFYDSQIHTYANSFHNKTDLHWGCLTLRGHPELWNVARTLCISPSTTMRLLK